MLVENRSKLRGEITVPGDRSISHRAVVLGALARGATEIDNFLMNEDCISTIDCLRKMQVSIEILQGGKIKVQGRGLYGLKTSSSPLNTGRSGTALRLLLGILSGQSFTSNVVRSESEMKKPAGRVVHYLRQMGANINGKDNGDFCPLTVMPANLNGICHELSVLETEIKTPILLAGLYANGETVVKEAVKSRNHTELLLDYLGANIRDENSLVAIHPVTNLYARHISVPGDISMAAYFITAALIVPNSSIIIKNVGINPTRTGMLNVYQSMGGDISILDQRIVSSEMVADISIRSSLLTGTKISRSQIPGLIDELLAIIVAAAFAEGTTEITGLSQFKIQSSGKIKAISLELAKMGARMIVNEDSLIIEGKETLKGTVVDSSNDHSLAMALSVAGMAAQGETMIRKTQAVDIVYPDFYRTFNKL